MPARTSRWPDASRLFVVGDDFGWSIDDDRARLTATARAASATTSAPAAWARFAKRQAVFHHDHFGALQPRWLDSSHRLGLGVLPRSPRDARATPSSTRRTRRCGATPRASTAFRSRTREMEELVSGGRRRSGEGLPDPDRHRPRALSARRRAGSRRRARGELGIAGVGFRRRLVPEGRRRLGGRARAEARSKARTRSSRRSSCCAARIPELVVLLTGPARGYVRRELERLGIPYRHVPPRLARPSSRARTTRSTSISSRRGRRVDRRACSSRWRRESRS